MPNPIKELKVGSVVSFACGAKAEVEFLHHSTLCPESVISVKFVGYDAWYDFYIRDDKHHLLRIVDIEN